MQKVTVLFLLVLVLSGCVSSPQNTDEQVSHGQPPVFEFQFFSSFEQEVSLAYLTKIGDQWQFTKMIKDGNRFYVNLPVEHEIWYEFVVPTNTWYRRDPFNRFVDHDHAYLNKDLILKGKYKNTNVKFISSEHFDLFTTGNEALIHELERQYTKLLNLLSAFGTDLAPVHGKKIQYYGGIFPGTYATAGNATIVNEGIDYANSHELIHVLMHKYPHYGPFAEGLAQCFQESGNRFPLAEENCTLAASRKVKEQGTKLENVLTNFTQFNDYHLAGSYIYFNIFIKNTSASFFIDFLKYFSADKWNISFERVKTTFQDVMGQSIDDNIKEWNSWIRSVDKDSQVFVNWK